MTPFVLLRGLTREAGHWGDFGEALARQLGQPVHALDLPGNGRLHAMQAPASVPALARDCRARLASEGLAGRPVLVAMSLGAMVALEWACAAPQQVAGCVLINTSLRGFSPFWQRLQPHNYPALLRLALPGGTVRQREQAVLGLTSSQPVRHAAVLPAWEALAQRHPVSRRNAAAQLLAAARYRPPGTPPALPVLVLASQGDRLVSSRCSEALARAWGWPLRLHPEAGHDLPLDAPDWVRQQIVQWWQASGPVGRPDPAG